MRVLVTLELTVAHEDEAWEIINALVKRTQEDLHLATKLDTVFFPDQPENENEHS